MNVWLEFFRFSQLKSRKVDTDLSAVVDEQPQLPPRQLLPGHPLGRGGPHQAGLGAEDGSVVTCRTRGWNTETAKSSYLSTRNFPQTI